MRVYMHTCFIFLHALHIGRITPSTVLPITDRRLPIQISRIAHSYSHTCMYAYKQAVLKQTAERVGKSRIVRMIKQTELLRTNRRTRMIGLLRVEEATRGWRR